ncbi:MAG: tetratricopeptide repeat protein [Halioglobus sp.]|nr:tetratricopeptide repeat protein [Halioglobus sp.]
MALHYLPVRLAPLGLALSIAGCSIYSAPGSGPAPVERSPEHTTVTPPPATSPPVTAPQTPRPPAEPATRAAYQPLLDRAEAATVGGDYEQALALLQRAQRIDPGSAQIYLGMARTHRARGDNAQSRATAERGLLYCRATAECDALRAYTR